MKQLIRKYIAGVEHLIYPNICMGCGSDALSANDKICFRCFAHLPETKFAGITDNHVERIFYGRLPIAAATSMYYFTKNSLLQHLLHLLKYKQVPEIGVYLGAQLGKSIKEIPRFNQIDYLIPVPLSKKRELKRGYNQALQICQGISDETGIPIANNLTYRIRDNETQTHKTRQERWENMQNVFEVANHEALQHKSILLVDDVITTGATLETCAATLMKKASVTVSVATLAVAMN